MTKGFDGVKNNIEKLGDIQAVKRLNSIKEEVILKIEEARKKIDDGKQALKENIELFKTWNGAGDGRIQVMLGPHAPYTCPPSYLKKVREIGEKYDIYL